MTPTISVMEFEKLLLDERAQTAQLRVKVEELERERGIGVGVGGVILNHDGKVFLGKRGAKVRNEAGMWDCPGGGVEKGNSLKGTLGREFKEEHNIVVSVDELLGVVDHIIPNEFQHWVSPVYLCSLVYGHPSIREPHKCDEIGWFTLEEMGRMNLTISTREILKLLKEKFEA